LGDKIEEHETNSKIKNIRDLYRDINDFKKGYQPRCNKVKMRKVTWLQTPTVLWLGGGTISSSYSTCMGLRALGRQKYVHTAEPLVPEPSAAEVELAIDKLKSHKSPGIDQIPAELIKAGGRTICLEIHKLINSIWEKEKLSEEWKESIIIPIHKKGDKTDCSNYRGISILPTNNKNIPTSCSQG